MSIKKIKKNLLLENLETNNRYYFLHSYYVENNKDFTIATSLKDDFIYCDDLKFIDGKIDDVYEFFND
jgi:imidazoleglycerol phosphate synthase glutamine amidotransferase subunit HisH